VSLRKLTDDGWKPSKISMLSFLKDFSLKCKVARQMDSIALFSSFPYAATYDRIKALTDDIKHADLSPLAKRVSFSKRTVTMVVPKIRDVATLTLMEVVKKKWFNMAIHGSMTEANLS
jgi:hypothetical protein